MGKLSRGYETGGVHRGLKIPLSLTHGCCQHSMLSAGDGIRVELAEGKIGAEAK